MTHQPHFTPELHEEPDQWHRHTPDEGEPQAEHAAHENTLILAGVFVAIVVFIASTITASVLYFNRHVTGLRREQIESTLLAGDALAYRDTSEAAQRTYTWADAEKGVVQLPLDVATRRVVEEYAGR